MAESRATIPDFALRMDVDMERCVALRGELKRLTDDDDAPTYNDMVVKACALALREHPRANASYRDGGFELHERVNVGVAVAVSPEDALASALVVPTVLDADRKALGEIARETRSLVQRVRDGAITPPELSGATFTVSNLGMYGIHSFGAIVNPPQAAILAVGAVQERPAVRDGQVGARHEMTMTLSCDHRILYGADAALFLARVRELLEEPAALTL
jgi:pyruvate dehydrogenase E2 component (dihydrolipoamide acetyltransferase)